MSDPPAPVHVLTRSRPVEGKPGLGSNVLSIAKKLKESGYFHGPVEVDQCFVWGQRGNLLD